MVIEDVPNEYRWPSRNTNTPKKQKSVPVLIVLVALLGAGLLGYFVGLLTAPDSIKKVPTPVSNAALGVAQSQVAQLDSKLSQAQSSIGKLNDSLVSATASPNTTDFIPGDGVYAVNTELKPGVYYSSTSDESCYWARLKASSDAAILDSATGPHPTVTLKESDGGLLTNNCGLWVKVG